MRSFLHTFQTCANVTYLELSCTIQPLIFSSLTWFILSSNTYVGEPMPTEEDLSMSDRESDDNYLQDTSFSMEDEQQNSSDLGSELQNVSGSEDESLNMFNSENSIVDMPLLSQDKNLVNENEPLISDTEEYTTEDTGNSTSSDTENEERIPIPELGDLQYFRKIYDGSNLSICTFNCCIMQLAIKHSLTYDAIGDLLDLLSFVCPKSNLVPNTLYKFKNFFNQRKNKSSNDIFCTNCHQLKQSCGCEDPSPAHLISLPIEKPLQSILNGKYLLTFCVYFKLSRNYGLFKEETREIIYKVHLNLRTIIALSQRF